MIKFSRKYFTGFTMIEVVVAVGLFSLIAVGLVILVSQILTQTNQQGGYLADSDQSRRVSFKLTQELRNSVPSNTGAYSLGVAGDQQIVFYSNIDGGIDIERLRYFLQGDKLMRGVVKPTGNPLTYNLANETTAVVQSNVANGGAPLFRYYNGNYSGTGNALAQPVNVTAVTFVSLDLRVFHKGTSSGSSYFTTTAGAAIRNLKTNLGQ